ncbi:zinc ABC transporter permease AztB [Sinomonas albida]|uniref:zinc ABC transporter permease AztB n=1 Tax=Sinomonas albida TaxID=369942 RepID=UPI00301ADB2B
MPPLADPPISDFLLRALSGGMLAALICGVVGTWVVIRGMAFFGEAIGHGMLPGVAVATVLGWPVLVGGAVSSIAMSGMIALLQRRGRLSYDTSIGLLFVGMLSVGVIVVSHSGTFATDATVMLFGDILAIGASDILVLAVTAMVTITIAAAFHRPFVAAAFDERIARSLGLRPQLAKLLQVGLVTLAVVASYKAVGSLLVVGLLLAPAVAASPWTTRIPLRMCAAVGFGTAAVVLGLTVSWYASTAAGASIAASAILLACCSAVAHGFWERLAYRRAARPGRAAPGQANPGQAAPGQANPLTERKREECS